MGSSAMSASPFSAFNGFHGSDDDDDDDDGRTALSQVRQALADRRRMRSGVIAGVVDPAAAASASPPLLGKPRKGTSHEPSLCVDRSDNENSADCQRRQAPGSHKQHRERRSPSAPDAFLSCVEDGKLLSVSSLPSPLTRTMSASPPISKSSAPVLRALPPSPSPRRIPYYGGFLTHTLDAHDLAGAVFPKSSNTDALPLPMSAPQTDNESSVAATDQSSARSRRERPAASGRSSAAFDKTLAEAMVSTVERMRENAKRRGSAAQPQQPLRRDSLSTNTTIGSTVYPSSHRPGPPTTPITSRAMAAFGHTTADVLNVADYSDSVGFHRATARGSPQHHNPNASDTDVYAGDFRSAPMAALTRPVSSSATASQHCLCISGTPESSSAPLRITASRDKERAAAARSPDARSRQSSTSPAAPSALWDITGQPVRRDGVRGLSTTASGRSGSTMMTVSSGTADVAVPEVAAKDAAPQLSYHQLTEAFYGSYKGGEMAQDAYLYFVAQQQHQQHHQHQHQHQLLRLQQPEGSSGGTTSRHGSKHQRSRPSVAMTTTPTRTAAGARGGCTVQRVFVSGRSESQPTMTSQASTTSLTAAAATYAAPAQLEPRSISTDTPLPALRRSFNAAAAAAAAAAEWQHPHSQREARPSSTSLVSVHSSNDGSCYSSASRGNGHGASSPSSPLRLSVTARAETAATTAARGAAREAVDDVGVQQQPRRTSTSRLRPTAVAVAHAAPSQRRGSGRSSFSMDAVPRDIEVDQMSEPPSAVASSSATAATDTATTTDRIQSLLHKSVSIYQEAQQQQSEPHEGPPAA